MSLACLVAALRERLDDLSARMAQRMRDEVAPYADQSLVPAAALVESCKRNVEHMLAVVISGGTDVRPARATGRIRAVQGVPLADTLHAYRVAFDFMWSEVLREAETHPEVTDADLVVGSAATWALYGRCAEAVADAHREASAERTLRHEARRSALVEALITGALVDPVTLRDTALQLGLPDRGPYVVVTADAPTPGVEPLPGIETALREACVPSAWRLQPDQQIGLVSMAHHESESICLSTLRSHGARSGVSPRFEALRDAPQALRFARLAADGLPGAGSGVALFDDNPLAMLVVAAPAEARRLVKVALGPVLDLPEHEKTRLLETLRQWFASGGSAAEAARELFVHPNTVRYRLRRIEELTGRSLGDPAALVDLGTALHAAVMLCRRD